MFKDLVKKLLENLGYALVRYDPRFHPDARERRLLADLAPTVVIDVGANEGEYGAELRARGYRGRIVSFEPRAEAFARLRTRSQGDPHWEVHSCGLAAQEGQSVIHVSGNRASSSLLPMADLHTQALPGSDCEREETIELRTLDGMLPELRLQPQDRVLLKIDVQGYEGAVLDGGAQTVARADGMYLELSLQPLYEGAPLIEDLIARLRQAGFAPAALAPTFSSDSTCHLLQVDGFFVRTTTPRT